MVASVDFTVFFVCVLGACPAGTKRNADDTGCIDCEVDTYQPLPYQDFCIDCGPNKGTRQVNSTSASQCEGRRSVLPLLVCNPLTNVGIF